jgi:uncharacterized protein (DUF58 family)
MKQKPTTTRRSLFVPLAALLPPLRRPALKRIFDQIEPEPGPVTLDRQRVFIFPTRHGFLFAVLLLVMLIGSINYNLSLGFVLTFLLGGMAVVSILHTYRTLAQLSVRMGKPQAVFAGQQAVFTVCLDNPTAAERLAVGAMQSGRPPAFADIAPGQAACLPLPVPAERRGILKPGRFTLFTHFPLGLFRAWSPMELEIACLVYPRPETSPVPPPAPMAGRGESGGQGQGQEDFSGLRTYLSGDSPGHVDWKAAARERGLLTKQFSGYAPPELWLDWDDLSGLDTEARLSRLCGWVLLAHAQGQHYGLRLPGKTLGPATGDDHWRRCLEALALFGFE